jgi:UDP-N-acetylmuramate--alanine ligase
LRNLDNIQFDRFKAAYFIGIGGIGMSALARYFNSLGWTVCGYDKTPSSLTDQLQQEGIHIHFEDHTAELEDGSVDLSRTLFVYTPAIPKDFGELQFILKHAPNVFKRSEVLGIITRQSIGLAVAGTHGKTTTSAMLANILEHSNLKCNAFLGGIATNFNSNLVLNPGSKYAVVEADEFDRSFLKLSPFASIITSTDPDHLDIYEDASHFLEGFQLFAGLVQPNGCLIKKAGLNVDGPSKQVTYAIEDQKASYCGWHLRYENERFLFDVATPEKEWTNVELGIPGIHNAENALACIAMAEFLGLTEEQIREGLSSFAGVKRRFEYHLKGKDLIYIDDYAHHPTEISALIHSVRMLYPDKKIIGAFQPHLFSRTRDFLEGFARELSMLDEVIVLPIYPARELPIPGITSEMLLDRISIQAKQLLTPNEAISYLSEIKEGVLLTIGAGDIDRIVQPLKQVLK